MGRRTNTAVWFEKYNRWQINVQKDGVRRTFTSSKPGRAGQREANKKADDWLDDNIDLTSTRASVLFDKYVEMLKLTTSESNWGKIESMGRVWFKPAIGHKKIVSLTEQDFQNILNKAYSKGLSKKTLLNMKSTITSFMKFCRKNKVTTAFFEDLTIPKGARTKEKQILQPKDLETLFSIDTTILNGKRKFDDYIYAYRFEVLTGLRPGELIGLRWSDIQDDMIYVSRSINIRGEETKGKNENAIRHFALTPTAKKVLEAQKSISSSESVFDISNMQHYYKRWKKYCRANGLPELSLYEIRHTFVSIAKNLSDGQVKPLVGHSVNMDTFGIYGHELNGELQKTASDLESIFESILG